MNKQEARAGIVNLKLERQSLINSLNLNDSQIYDCQAIIDAQEPQTGRVISADDLALGVKYFVPTQKSYIRWSRDSFDFIAVSLGQAFHDRASCEKYIELLSLEQTFRAAKNQIDLLITGA